MINSDDLVIPDADGNAVLTSKSVWGALRGLETFSQIVLQQGDNQVMSGLEHSF